MIVKPRELDGIVSNPWMGWGLWAGPIYFDGTVRTLAENTAAFGDDAPLFDWVLVDWMWADLEPREGEFHWDELDAVIEYWAARGKQINLRVWVTDDPGWNGAPGADEVCPNWVYDGRKLTPSARLCSVLSVSQWCSASPQRSRRPVAPDPRGRAAPPSPTIPPARRASSSNSASAGAVPASPTAGCDRGVTTWAATGRCAPRPGAGQWQAPLAPA